MEVTQEHKQEIEQIASKLQCSKGFICYKSGLEDLCKARDIGIEGYLYCLEEEPQECEFALSFGEVYICTCPVRDYIAKNMKV